MSLDRLRPSWQPGFLVPVVLAAWLAADVGLRALPLDRVSYRVWEALRTFGAETPFRPNARYDRPRVYGNLAALGNQPDLREYHRVVFTTDSLGYHNRPELASRGRVSAMLFGSSFSAGSEVSDWESPAVQIGRAGGREVYNAAPSDPAPARVRTLADQVGMREGGGLVIFELLESAEPPPIIAALPHPRELRCRVTLGVWDGRYTCWALTWVSDHLDVSPLQVFAARLYRRLQNDLMLPNAAARHVIRTRLQSGTELLFLADERATYHRRRSSEDVLRRLTWLSNRLALQRQRLLVVLTPHKYSVYAPLLAEPDTGPAETPRYFAALEAGLRARGIAVVDLLEPLRAAARDAAARRGGSLIFWRDDTHWNAAGIAAGARAIATAARAAATP